MINRQSKIDMNDVLSDKRTDFICYCSGTTKEKIKDKSITIELTDFVTHYTQDDIEELQQSMRAGSKVVIEDGQIIKVEKDKNGIITKTILTIVPATFYSII